MFKFSSVTTHRELLPVLPSKVIAPSGILSAVPSTQNVKVLLSPPVIVPPSGLLVLTTSI